jgi:hypothetical protein
MHAIRHRRRPTRAVLLPLLALLAMPARAADPATNLERLREMPLERRQALARNLQQFDALTATEQAAIRELDRQLAELPDEDRARYLGVLHRYHLWLRTLTDEQRRSLQGAPPERRMALVRKLAAGRSVPTWRKADRAVFLGSTLNPSPLFDQAYSIRVWLALTDGERAEIGKLPARQRPSRLAEIGRLREIPDPRPPMVRRFEENLGEQMTKRPGLRKAVEALKPQAKAVIARRLAEARFLARDEAPAVDPRSLDRFVALVPGWLLEPLDGLPPEPARQRLSVLYRLAVPEGQELPAQPRGESATRPAEPKPQPKTNASGERSTPF